MKHFYIIFVLVVLFALVSTSTAQVHWTKDSLNNPVLDPGSSGEWDDNAVLPSCVLLEDTLYRMWYMGHDGSIFRIGHATSPNETDWEKDILNNPVLDIGQPGSWDDARVVVPYILHHDSLYQMWYSGSDGTTSRIGYATSTDGIIWTKYDDPDTPNPPYAESDPVLVPGPPGSWYEGGVSGPCIRFDGTTYHMWFHGWVASEANTSIGYATSTDGINWMLDTLNSPVLTPSAGSWDSHHVEVPRVIFDGNTYHMWYHGRNTPLWFRWRIGYAKSQDGINWMKDTLNNPVLAPSIGSWDDQWVGFCSVILDSANSIYKMWYSGGNANWDGHIGYATAPVVINVPGEAATIQEAIDIANDGNIVLVDDGTYYENINFKGKAITVASRFLMDGDTSHISNTIINGSQPSDPDSGSVVSFVSGEDTTSVLCGFTITGGSGSYNSLFNIYAGGGIYMLAGGKICHNIIADNHLEHSGFLNGGAGLLYFAGNTNYNLFVEHNEIKNNSVSGTVHNQQGGGIYCKWIPYSGGSIRICNNQISYNIVTNTDTYKAIAGGIGFSIDIPNAVDAVVENNIITHNELHCIASMGAGIYVVYWEPGGIITDTIPSPLIRNNIIADNYSQDKGAGIGIWTVQDNHNPNSVISPQPAIINNTIVNNRASDGSGIFNFDSYPLLLNNILWNDLSIPGSREIFNDDITYPEYSDHINDGVIYAYYSDIQNGWSGGVSIIDADPLFTDTIDYRLSDSSPCIGTGIDFIQTGGAWYYAPPTDIGGNPRPDPPGSVPDIGAWESPLDSPVVGIHVLDTGNIPKTYSLRQNYPNPFNPSTNIEFSIPKSEFVILKVYNILGEEVATLVSERLAAGSYKYDWDAGKLASGVYLYKIKSGEFQQIKKMVLIK